MKDKPDLNTRSGRGNLTS